MNSTDQSGFAAASRKPFLAVTHLETSCANDIMTAQHAVSGAQIDIGNTHAADITEIYVQAHEASSRNCLPGGDASSEAVG